MLHQIDTCLSFVFPGGNVAAGPDLDASDPRRPASLGRHHCLGPFPTDVAPQWPRPPDFRSPCLPESAAAAPLIALDRASSVEGAQPKPLPLAPEWGGVRPAAVGSHECRSRHHHCHQPQRTALGTRIGAVASMCTRAHCRKNPNGASGRTAMAAPGTYPNGMAQRTVLFSNGL